MLRGFRSASFDGEGVATRKSMLVDAGIVRRYVLGSYSARKLGLATTANAGGVHNLQVKANAGDLAAQIQAMGRGLLVTELMGRGVNAITGDYSRGAAGFWVENGVLAYPVDGITIAGNLKTMFAAIETVGNDGCAFACTHRFDFDRPHDRGRHRLNMTKSVTPRASTCAGHAALAVVFPKEHGDGNDATD